MVKLNRQRTILRFKIKEKAINESKQQTVLMPQMIHKDSFFLINRTRKSTRQKSEIHFLMPQIHKILQQAVYVDNLTLKPSEFKAISYNKENKNLIPLLLII